MCGIIASVGDGDTVVDDLLVGLTNLEYRGYDSAGIAVQNNGRVHVCKRSGDITNLRDALSTDSLHGSIGIGHTRWSTHGPPTDANAHPHTDCTGQIAVVHNGIIENYDSLHESLRDAGHTFESDTDTEVVPHLIEAALHAASSPSEAFRAAIDQIDGSYAIAATIGGTDEVYAARNDSPS